MTRNTKNKIYAWSVVVGAALLGVGLYFLKISLGAWWIDDALIVLLAVGKAIEIWNERRN